MPLTPELRRGIDRIRDYLFGGGFPDPAQNAEQLSYLFFFYMFEAADAARVRAARRPGAEGYAGAFEGEWTLRNPRNARAPGEAMVPRDTLRWSSWANALNGERLVSWVREEVFPFYASVAAEGVTNFMAGARLVIDEPTVLSQVVSLVSDLHLEQVDADTKGDLFEHMLRQIRQAGELGQFRTPSWRMPLSHFLRSMSRGRSLEFWTVHSALTACAYKPPTVSANSSQRSSSRCSAIPSRTRWAGSGGNWESSAKFKEVCRSRRSEPFILWKSRTSVWRTCFETNLS